MVHSGSIHRINRHGIHTDGVRSYNQRAFSLLRTSPEWQGIDNQLAFSLLHARLGFDVLRMVAGGWSFHGHIGLSLCGLLARFYHRDNKITQGMGMRPSSLEN